MMFKDDPSFAPVVFAIGRALKGHVDMERREIFGTYSPDDLVGPANQAIDFFAAQCAAARQAVDAWCLIALRIGNDKLNRDIRKKIALLIWEARELAEYKRK